MKLRNKSLVEVASLAVGMLAGFLVGLLIRLPFFPWLIPEKAEEMLATTVSAAIAVFGAAAISQSISNRERHTAREVVVDVIDPVIDSLKAVCHWGGCFGQVLPQYKEKFPKACGDAFRSITEASARLKLMSRTLHGLGPTEAIAIADATRYLADLDKHLNRLETTSTWKVEHTAPAAAEGCAKMVATPLANLELVRKRIQSGSHGVHC